MADTQNKDMRGLINISADLGKTADVANNLPDKVAAAVGWFATRETPKRIALKGYIREIQNSDLPPLEKAAKIHNAKADIKAYIAGRDSASLPAAEAEPGDELARILSSELPEHTKAICASVIGKSAREHSRQEAILAEAILNLKESARPEDVGEDWLSQFMDKARLVSDEEMQLIWGRILAGECNAPGSVPKSLLHILEQMEKSHAESFTALRSISVHVQWGEGEELYYPFYFDFNNPSPFPMEYFLLLIEKATPDAIWELISLGLLVKDEGMALSSQELCYYDEFYQPETEHDFIDLPLGELVYTQAGQALCRSIQVPKEEGFFEEICIPFWQKTLKKKEKEHVLSAEEALELLGLKEDPDEEDAG